MNAFDLNQYFSDSIKTLIRDVLANTFNNPAETKFLLQFRKESARAARVREEWEDKGQHIPALLICSITRTCNLFCKGCYAWKTGICGDENANEMLTETQWGNIFMQAADLGVSFILLAGGEPLTRNAVLLEAAKRKEIIFPIFTNGLLIDEKYATFFNDNRHLVPILSMEGTQQSTDFRRGNGVYDQVISKMNLLKKEKVLFGVSVTVGKHNLAEVTSDVFLQKLKENGCRVLFYIEYVPVDRNSQEQAFTNLERERLANIQEDLRGRYPSIFFMSFPGDEKMLGGCLAAGRGFFHISPDGNAEPCPFSPYSDRNLKQCSLLSALSSPLFNKLKDARLIGGEHDGGCALFENDELVRRLLSA